MEDAPRARLAFVDPRENERGAEASAPASQVDKKATGERHAPQVPPIRLVGLISGPPRLPPPRTAQRKTFRHRAGRPKTQDCIDEGGGDPSSAVSGGQAGRAGAVNAERAPLEIMWLYWSSRASLKQSRHLPWSMLPLMSQCWNRSRLQPLMSFRFAHNGQIRTKDGSFRQLPKTNHAPPS